MKWRIFWGIVLFGMAFILPWWAAFVFGMVGTILFSWYAEFAISGAIIDAISSGVAVHWYGRVYHAALFAMVLLLCEFIKSNTTFKK